MSSVTGITSIASTQTVQANAAPVAGATSTASLVQQSAPALSPHITVDPVAGVITQYLNSTGKVTSQYPSAVTIAYLRAGLDAHGYSRHHDTLAALNTAASSSNKGASTFA